MTVKWIKHKGKTILFSDYSGLDEPEHIKAMEKTLQQFTEKSPQDVLVLTNLADTQTTERVKEKANELTARITPRTKAQAVIGLDGLKRTLVELFIRDVYIADSFEEAVEWLIKQ